MPGVDPFKRIGGDNRRKVKSSFNKCRKGVKKLFHCRRRPEVIDEDLDPPVRLAEPDTDTLSGERNCEENALEEVPSLAKHFQDGICAVEDKAQIKLTHSDNSLEEPPSSPRHFQDGVCAAGDKVQDKLECLENAFEEPPSSPRHSQDGVCAAENEAQDKLEHLARMPKTRRIFVKPATSSMDFPIEHSRIGNSNEKGPKKPGGASCEERSSQRRAAFDEKLRSSSGINILHRVCQGMPDYDLEVATEMANILALNHLRLMTEHYFDTCDKYCDNLMYTVLSSPYCNLDIAFQYFIYTANERLSMYKESDQQVKAIRAIGAIVKYNKDVKKIRKWLIYLYTTLSHALLVQSRKHKEGETSYISQEEILEILSVLMERLDLMRRMTDDIYHMPKPPP